MKYFLRYEFGGLSGGPHTWRGLFSEFYGRLFTTTSSKRLLGERRGEGWVGRAMVEVFKPKP